MKLRPVTSDDDLNLSILLDSTFGGPQMYAFAQQLRAAGEVAMERVAEEDGHLIGYICCARMLSPENWWALSILAVSPRYRKNGMGRELVYRGMDHARREGAPAVVVVGDPDYFAQVGFSKGAAKNLVKPFASNYTSLYPIAPHTGLANHVLVYPKAYAKFGDALTPAG